MSVRSLWAVDIAERAPGGVWQLIAPGPSLERTIDQLDPSFPTMAVGQALRAPVTVDYYVEWEAPADRHRNAWLNRGVQGPTSDPQTVITSATHSKKWHDWLAERLFREPRIIGQHRKDPIPDPWKDARLETGPAWVLAIRAMVLRGGAKLICCYGLDLDGEGYAFGAPDPRLRTPEDWAGRWQGERVLLERMQALLDSLDVELVLVRPE